MQTRIYLLVAVLISGVFCVAQLDENPITCRTGPGCFNGTDHFDWTNNFGSPFTTIPNGSVATSVHGRKATIEFAGGGAGERRDQGISGGWNGNFSPGDELLWTNSPGQGEIILTINKPYGGFGVNIQADFYGAFTAFLCVDELDTQFCVYEDGQSNANGDGSAIFIGTRDWTLQGWLEIGLLNCALDCGDFAINQLDVSPAPEPGSLILMSSGFVGLAGFTRYRRISLVRKGFVAARLGLKGRRAG